VGISEDLQLPLLRLHLESCETESEEQRTGEWGSEQLLQRNAPLAPALCSWCTHHAYAAIPLPKLVMSSAPKTRRSLFPSKTVNMTAVKAGLSLRSFLWRARTRAWGSLALVLWLAAGRASPSEAEGAAFASFASAARNGCPPSSAPQLCAPRRSPEPPRAPAERHRLLPLLRMGARGRGNGGRTEGAEAGSACALDALRLSRRSALGAGFVGLLAVAAAPDASGALEAAAVVAGPAAGSAKKEAKPLSSTLSELLKPALPDKAAEAAKKEAKIANEMRTVDTELRKEYIQIRKDLQADLKALENGLDKRLRALQEQLTDGNRRISTEDVQRLDKVLRDQAQKTTRSIEDAIARLDLRVADLDSQIAKKKYVQDLANKKKELAGQLRAAAKKVGDEDLRQKMLFEADLLEQATDPRKLSVIQRVCVCVCLCVCACVMCVCVRARACAMCTRMQSSMLVRAAQAARADTCPPPNTHTQNIHTHTHKVEAESGLVSLSVKRDLIRRPKRPTTITSVSKETLYTRS
jgi:hypothetical protein